jgi:putative tricarboxylic transport membrane protein
LKHARRDLAFGAACLALAAGYYLMAAAIPESALSDAVGPQGLPKTYAVVLGSLSLILIARSSPWTRGHRNERSHRNAPPSPQPLPPSPLPPLPSPPPTILRAAGMLVIGIVYLAVVPWLGYVLSLSGLIAATTYYQGGGLNARVAAVGLAGALFFWVLFVAVLGIAHPPGIWPTLF